MKPMNGSFVGSKRKAVAIETNKAKKTKLTGGLNQNTSLEASAYGAKKHEQPQLSPLTTVAAGTQSSDETESSTDETFNSSVSASVPQILVYRN